MDGLAGSIFDLDSSTGCGPSGNRWLKAMGVRRMLHEHWFNHVFFLDRYMCADIKSRTPDAPVSYLPRFLRRVGEDVTTLTPHRSGRAALLHPVPHERVSLTAL
jgi:hypothetical protein